MKSTIEAELDALHKEMAALRADLLASKRLEGSEPVLADSSGETDKVEPSAIQELVSETRAFLDAAGDDIAAHPVASVVGALIAGVLLGALIRG